MEANKRKAGHRQAKQVGKQERIIRQRERRREQHEQLSVWIVAQFFSFCLSAPPQCIFTLLWYELILVSSVQRIVADVFQMFVGKVECN